jgi:hypothetical protein
MVTNAYQSYVIVNNQKEKICPLDRRIKEFFQRIFQSNIPLPKILIIASALKGIEVKHIHSYLQRGGSCGWYSVLNACAIEELVHQEKEITAQAIEEIVIRLISYIEKHRYTIAEVIQRPDIFSAMNQQQQINLAEYLGLQNYYPLLIDGSGYWWSNNKKRIISNKEYDENTYYRFNNLKELFDMLLKEDTIVKHFIIATEVSHVVDDAHGVLISLVRPRYSKPMIIYMDSNNVLLKNCSLDYVTPFFVTKAICCLIDAYCKNYGHDFYTMRS